MTDNVQVKIEAVWNEFKSGMTSLRQFTGGIFDGMKQELKSLSDEAKNDAKTYESTFEQMGNVVAGHFKGLNGAIAGVKAAWAQLAVVIGAGMFAKAAIDEAVNYNVEIQKLSRTLGITTNAASALSMAIGDVYGSTEAYTAAVKGLDKNLRTNEDGIKAMGIATREANGEFRNQQDIMLDAMEALRGYKEGTDRNLAATTIFGKGIEVSSEMLQLNAEKIAAATAKTNELNMVVGQQGVEATNEYRAAMNDAEDVVLAFKVAVGNELMPILTELAKFFAEYGPTAIMATRIAINILMALFRGLALVVKAVYEVVTAAFAGMADYCGVFGEVFSKIMSGDFAGAQAAAAGLFDKLANRAGIAFDNIIAAAGEAGSKTVDSFANIIDPKVQGESGGNASGKGYVDTEAEDKKTKSAEDAARKAAAAAKAAAAEQHRLDLETYQNKMAMLKGEEEAHKGHWDKLLELQREQLEATIKMYGENSREATAMRNKIMATERAAADEYAKIQELKNEALRNSLMARINLEESAAAHAYQMGMLGEEAYTQMLIEFENRRYQIKFEALQAQALLAADEPLKQQEIYNELELLAQQHELALQQIKQEAKAAAPMETMFKAMETSFASAITGMLTGAMTLKQGLTSIFTSIFQTFVQEMIAKPLAQWAVRIARELLMHKVLNLQKNVVEKAQAVSNITKSAAQAGAAGTASFAAAPWPINLGAPAFGAAMAAASAGFLAGASAEKGFDIGLGENPVTQLHQKEMVLPAEQADVIRNLASGRQKNGYGTESAKPTTQPRYEVPKMDGATAGDPGVKPPQEAQRMTGSAMLEQASKGVSKVAGYDVPTGSSPASAEQQKEMSLPQAQVDIMRDLSESGAAGGPTNITIHAVDAQSVEQLIRNNSSAIAAGLRDQVRDYGFTGVKG